MGRELNPDLFGVRSLGRGDSEGNNSFLEPTPSSSQHPLRDPTLRLFLSEVKEQLHAFTVKMGRFEQWYKELKLRQDRESKKSLESNKRIQNSVQDLQARFQNLNLRINDRANTDKSLERVIEKHNMIVRRFESRMMQLQKVIDEKDVQLLNMKALLDEARQDLSRLKKL
jgi:chromosome segregation ATPase